MTTTLTLASLPPSANHIWRTGKRGTYRNPKYVAWLQAEGLLLKSQMRGQEKFDEPVCVQMDLRQPRSNADLDNRLKPTSDLLESVGVVSNDKLIWRWDFGWQMGMPKGIAAYIEIMPIYAIRMARAA